MVISSYWEELDQFKDYVFFYATKEEFYDIIKKGNKKVDKKGLSDLIRDNKSDYKKYVNQSVVENLDILTKGMHKLSYSKLLFSNVIGKIIERIFY